MKKLNIILIVIASLSALLIIFFVLTGFFKPKPGGLYVDTTPVSSVYINEEFVGKTPFRGTNRPGQISLRLIPEVANQNLIGYETKVNLTSGIETVVRREFGESEETSSGDVISFDKTGGDTSSLVVVSTPDNSEILVDGVPQGFSPYNASSIVSGSHEITVKAVGFKDRTMSVKTQKGFRLTIYAKLSKSEEVAQQTTDVSESSPKTFVVIGDTPTGFLRMRTKPGTSGEEIAELKPGERYPFIEGDLESGWYKIQYKEAVPGLPQGIVGWISNEYSTISTESGTLE